MNNELNEYLRNLFSTKDPVIYSIAIVLFFLFIIYIFYRYIFFPSQKKHFIEKKELEMKGIKLMALFAELDPEPAIRIDENGKILQVNEAAKIIDLDNEHMNRSIRAYLPELPENLPELIRKNSAFNISFGRNGKFYDVSFKSVPGLQMAQLYFKDLTERNLFEKELIESKKNLQHLSNHIHDTVEEERKRIALELHDSIGQNLMFIKLMLRECKSMQQFEKMLDSLLSTLDSTIIELKRISYQLKPIVLDETDLYSAIISLANSFIKESKISGEVNFIGKRERFNNKIEIVIYRVMQETLTNILKHSNANHFSIQMINNEKSIKIVISDDGIGIRENTDSQFHFGFPFMKERIESVHGTFKVDSSPGDGTVIIISIPKNIDNYGK